MKKIAIFVLTLALLFTFAACGGGGGAADTDSDQHHLRVGIVGAFNIHWEVIQEMVAEEGIDLELVYFSDFMTPNRALDEGDIDLNAFQHIMFLETDIAANGYEITPIAETLISPLNIFANHDRITSIADLQDGHTVAIPSDPTNSGRALRLLEAAGLIVLDPNVDGIPSQLDIIERIVDIEILEAEAGILANMLPDIEAAAINGTNALSAGLRLETDSIFAEDITQGDVSALNNVIVVRTEDIEAGGLRMELFETIVNAYHTERIREVMLEEFGGALLPLW